MKKIITIIYSSLLIVGCSKELDLKPTQSIDEADVFTSDANIKAALNGAYDVVSNASFMGGDIQLYAELLGADKEIEWVGTYNEPDEVYRKAMLTNNVYIRDTWLYGYKAVNICNNILEAINIVDENDRDRVQGEALFLRGQVYFELVKLFAKPYSAGNTAANPGLQLISEPTVGDISDANRVPRSSLEDTYAFILDDLKQAKELLPEPDLDEPTVYANKYVAAAVLSRVYLQMGDYPNARQEANEVIESGYYSLTANYTDEFNNTSNTSEDIFALQVSAQHDENDMHLFWSIIDYGAREGDVAILQKHLNLYTAQDKRRALFYIDDQDIYRSGKWKLQYKNIPFIRLAEMYLTRAECNFRLGGDLGATPDEDMNETIRARVGADPIAVTLSNILMERRLELAHEGQRIHDIKRLKQPVDGFEYDANKLVMPIPIREINAVGENILKQNDGY
ncbi:MAG: RagB/SusD family nutrient uptake outer membrane protein [Chitinophagaceae bacterium]|nr:RagB/SusD family nutrient uptake outer membrane protein [Chitinophagaceae bacterium]